MFKPENSNSKIGTTNKNITNTIDTSMQKLKSTHMSKNNNSNVVIATKPKPKTYKAYDIAKQRYVNYTNPYGKTAKRLYKQYISIGLDAEMVTPSDLKYYPDSGRFYKQTPKKEKPTWLKIEEKTSFKKYLATYSIANKLNIQAYAGIDLMNNFKPQLLNMLSLHNGIKFYFDRSNALW